MLTKSSTMRSQHIAAHAAACLAAGYLLHSQRYVCHLRRCHCPRIRRSVQDIYLSLGERYFRRAFRMSYPSFWCLHERLKDHIKDGVQAVRMRRRIHRRINKTMRRSQPANNHSPNPPPPPNGSISTSIRLAPGLCSKVL